MIIRIKYACVGLVNCNNIVLRGWYTENRSNMSLYSVRSCVVVSGSRGLVLAGNPFANAFDNNKTITKTRKAQAKQSTSFMKVLTLDLFSLLLS